MRSVVRFTIVAALTAVELAFALPDIMRLEPLGDFGFSSTTNVVTGIVPGGSAAREHIAVGDSFEPPSQQARLRWFDPSGSSFISVHPGDEAAIGVVHGKVRRSVTLIAAPFEQYPPWFASLRVIVETFWLLLAAFLVLRRPNLTTWCFFAFSLFPDVAPMALGPLILPLPLVVLHHIGFEASVVVAPVAAIGFILSLGARPIPRWHRTAAALLVPLFVAANLPIAVANLLWYFWAIPSSVLDFSTTIAYGAVQVAWGLTVLVLLGAIYAKNKGKDRLRLTWVFVGFAIYAAASTAVALLPPGAPLLVLAVLWTAYGALPICVAYAILKHRLIDVNFFVSRALVYAVISAGVFLLFSSIDWLFSSELSAQRLSVVVKVAVALAVGFAFSRMHHQVDHFTNSIFFRRKHRAEKHLGHLARALPHATSQTTINHGLVDEPSAALDLASAALFERHESVFQCVYARGWPEDGRASLNLRDLDLLTFRPDRDATILDEALSKKVALPAGPAKPDVALPVFIHGETVAIALYGAHKHGEHLDRDEVAVLEELAVAAAAGYAHVAASQLRRASESATQAAHVAMIETRLLQRENEVLQRSRA